MTSVKKENRNWIVFANEKLCDHVKAMSEIHCCNWASHHYRFEIGDGVYMYVCNIDGETRRIRYKTIVEAVHLTDRVDKSYWHIPLSGNESCLLRLVEEYYGTALDEEEIKKHGFKDFNAGSAKLVKGELLFYIEECFSV